MAKDSDGTKKNNNKTAKSNNEPNKKEKSIISKISEKVYELAVNLKDHEYTKSAVDWEKIFLTEDSLRDEEGILKDYHSKIGSEYVTDCEISKEKIAGLLKYRTINYIRTYVTRTKQYLIRTEQSNKYIGFDIEAYLQDEKLKDSVYKLFLLLYIISREKGSSQGSNDKSKFFDRILNGNLEELEENIVLYEKYFFKIESVNDPKKSKKQQKIEKFIKDEYPMVILNCNGWCYYIDYICEIKNRGEAVGYLTKISENILRKNMCELNKKYKKIETDCLFAPKWVRCELRCHFMAIYYVVLYLQKIFLDVILKNIVESNNADINNVIDDIEKFEFSNDNAVKCERYGNVSAEIDFYVMLLFKKSKKMYTRFYEATSESNISFKGNYTREEYYVEMQIAMMKDIYNFDIIHSYFRLLQKNKKFSDIDRNKAFVKATGSLFGLSPNVLYNGHSGDYIMNKFVNKKTKKEQKKGRAGSY